MRALKDRKNNYQWHFILELKPLLTLVYKNVPKLNLYKAGFFINYIACKQINNFYCYFLDNWYYNLL